MVLQLVFEMLNESFPLFVQKGSLLVLELQNKVAWRRAKVALSVLLDVEQTLFVCLLTQCCHLQANIVQLYLNLNTRRN